MVDLMRKETGTQFLLQPVRDYSAAWLPHYGANYFDYEPGGFDDCFPTITASTCPIRKGTGQSATIHFPGFGELWSLPWDYHISEESIHLAIRGVRFDYEFSKTIRLLASTIQIEYRLINFSGEPLPYIWSAHPLLEIQGGSRILLDKNVEAVMLEWASLEDIGKSGDILPWPWLSDRHDTNHAVSSSCEDTFAMKLYTQAQATGYCGYERADTSEKLLFEFDPPEIPYVGISWGYNDRIGQTGNCHPLLSIQPSRGRPDSLQMACERHEHTILKAFGMDEWSLNISLT
ncbi:MAG: hypothetical protein P8Y60_14540 [Calditrichota bacterium]